MRIVRDGISASPGIVIGPAHLLRWEVPRVQATNVDPSVVDREVERLTQARHAAQARLREIQQQTAERLGNVEAQIFEPQILMLDDEELVGVTERYIRESALTAARALELRVLELRSEWRRIGHPMMLDKLTDLLDVEVRVMHELLGLAPPGELVHPQGRDWILVCPDLTPSLTVQLDPGSTLGIAMDTGTRTAHSAILARAMGIPAVVALGDLSEQVGEGQNMILDGRTGRVIVDPTEADCSIYRQRDIHVREWERELEMLAHVESVTPDRQDIQLRANIDLPGEARTARLHGAEGVGLFRTEFLVVGRSAMPDEDDQYHAYREVAEAFPEHAVYIRTFDLGGDKFPRFLQMPAEENPFLGWRAIRVCLDRPDLFRTQLRALLRATPHGDVRIMLPLVNEVEEVQRTRQLMEDVEVELERQGVAFNPGYKLGVMLETPAAVLIAEDLARHCDFFSVGTNDLVQYTLAVDRGNARLASRFTPFHPAVVKLLDRAAQVGRRSGVEVSVCGEMAANPLGVFLLIGLGITALSMASSALPEIKKVVRTVPASAARKAAADALNAATPGEIMTILTDVVSEWLDLSMFSGRWNLSPVQ